MKENNPRQTAKILWIAFVGAVLVYYLLAFIVKQSGKMPEIHISDSARLPVFLGALLVSLGILPILLNFRNLRDARVKEGLEDEYLRFSVLMFTTCETPALLGLALYLTLQQVSGLLILTGLSLVYLFISRPE